MADQFVPDAAFSRLLRAEARARALLERCRFRPGWTIEVAERSAPLLQDESEYIVIRIFARVPDSRAYEGPVVPAALAYRAGAPEGPRVAVPALEPELPLVTIGLIRPIPLSVLEELSDELFFETVFASIDGLEAHETREWWVVDGERPHDPHRGEGVIPPRIRGARPAVGGR